MLGLGMGVMINRESGGDWYLIVRGEIVGFMKEEEVGKDLGRMF